MSNTLKELECDVCSELTSSEHMHTKTSVDGPIYICEECFNKYKYK